MTYIFIDTETTGLPFRDTGTHGRTHSTNGYPRPVQAAWGISSSQDTAAPEFRRGCIRPADFTMPEEVAQLNGFTQERLLSEGADETALMDNLMKDVRKADCIVGHNTAFDITVLAGRLLDMGRKEDAAALLSKPARDTMTESMEWCAIPKKEDRTYDYPGKYKFPRLSELHGKLFGHTFGGAHDAAEDAAATCRCFFELRRRGIIG